MWESLNFVTTRPRLALCTAGFSVSDPARTQRLVSGLPEAHFEGGHCPVSRAADREALPACGARQTGKGGIRRG